MGWIVTSRPRSLVLARHPGGRICVAEDFTAPALFFPEYRTAKKAANRYNYLLATTGEEGDWFEVEPCEDLPDASPVVILGRLPPAEPDDF